MDDCFLCGKGNLSPFTDMEPWDHILFRSETFIAFPAIGSMVEGWLLIATERHELCMGALTEDQLDELQAFCAEVKGHLEPHYGPITVFEQGSARPLQTAGGGLYHAHVNLVPFSGDLTAGAKAQFPTFRQWRQVAGLHATKAAHREGLAYLYIEQPDRPKYILTSPDLHSHIPRRVIAFELMMGSKYDWRSYPFAENAAATVGTLTGKALPK